MKEAESIYKNTSSKKDSVCIVNVTIINHFSNKNSKKGIDRCIIYTVGVL